MSWKQNADKTFYVIGWNDEGGGLFWIVNKVCMHIAYALDHGYIPVVDLKNYITQYTLKNEKKMFGRYSLNNLQGMDWKI